MGQLPDEPEALQQRLEGWAAGHQREADQGPASLSERARRSLTRARQAPAREAIRFVDLVMDRGLHSSGHTEEPEHAHDERVSYFASAWHVLPRALRTTGVSDRDTFVDFGCGKGRVLHQAAKRPFRRVIGVEISPALAELASAGIAARSRQHRCNNVEIVVCDAAAFAVPDDMTIAYFFDPFRGETLDAVLRGIVESMDRSPRRVRMIYVHPARGSQVLATGRFRLLKELRGGLHDARQERAAIFESC